MRLLDRAEVDGYDDRAARAMGRPTAAELAAAERASRRRIRPGPPAVGALRVVAVTLKRDGVHVDWVIDPGPPTSWAHSTWTRPSHAAARGGARSASPTTSARSTPPGAAGWDAGTERSTARRRSCPRPRATPRGLRVHAGEDTVEVPL